MSSTQVNGQSVKQKDMMIHDVMILTLKCKSKLLLPLQVIRWRRNLAQWKIQQQETKLGSSSTVEVTPVAEKQENEIWRSQKHA